MDKTKSVIYGLPNEEYHSGTPYKEYLSSTQIKRYLVSPKAFKYALDNPEEGKSDALHFGALFHDRMACHAKLGNGCVDPVERWLESIAVFKPRINEKTGKPYGTATNIYAQDYEAFLKANEGKIIAGEDDVARVDLMTRSLLDDCGATSEQVRKLLRWGKPEVSIFYETPDGIKLKIRPDLLTPKKIVDWKTTTLEDLTEDSINRAILKYGYHISAPMYQYVAKQVLGKWHDFFLVFVQKQPPYDCVMVDMANYGYRYRPDTDMVVPGPGALEFKRLLDLHTGCVKSGEWPGAETFIPGDKYRIMEIEPPRYYANKFTNEY